MRAKRRPYIPVTLSQRLLPDIHRQMEAVKCLHERDGAAGFAGVFLPAQLGRKYRNAAREFPCSPARRPPRFPSATSVDLPGGEPDAHRADW